MRVGDNDKLYGSVTTAIIGDALTAQGIEVDRRRILLDHPIRTLGDHPSACVCMPTSSLPSP